ncbi:aminotransferase class III-fold pyridoxal phosphate-dependent enzyme [Arenibacter sp. BSSL-BM3]|uniref:Aminotransferase class III-fold pyridoxal phosphate-dependent enzyme n=1 Tax=Arenibacter arenosicollis TaxID=2762274 RepID=A0ABR7QT34_9FLAO|nr:aminotransferase class III-fold pyridoxal phosphate-dependent enzyme [Arenibacter arenosicollis]MBC8770087.1 aminotransferase class III-fold pyridoxal phosphate-dependent enzyme [Arenibacter arenosicollis]
MEYSKIIITADQATNIALENFDIQGSAKPLPGEIDFNFKIDASDGQQYILKVSRPDENEDYLDFQQKLLLYASEHAKDLTSPQVVPDRQGNLISEIRDDYGQIRKVRLLSWISGRVWSGVNPQLDGLRHSLGEQCGRLTRALQGFDHPEAHREFVWDVAQGGWTTEYLDLFKNGDKEVISYFQNQFKEAQPGYSKLRKAVVHNDANDNNVIVSGDLIDPHVISAIDFGDSVHTQIINDLAVACAYAIMGHNDPLEAALPIVRGYHHAFPLEETELEHLFMAIAMRLVISVTKSAINKKEEPDNSYLLISEEPAWELLRKWRNINADFAYFSFRGACGYTAHPNEEKFSAWAKKQSLSIDKLFPTVGPNTVYPLDLSVSSKWIGHEKDFNDLDYFQYRLNKLQEEHPSKILAGGYLEPRPIYTTSSYDKKGNKGRESRSIHLGIDFWLPEASPVHALFDGEVVTAVNDAGDKEYGGLVILRHREEDLEFYTLYGHLSVGSATRHKVGVQLRAGDEIGVLGSCTENGNWSPHLHFQIMLSMLDFKIDFPGVGYYGQLDLWKSLCPDPNMLFKLKGLSGKHTAGNDEIIAYRKQHLGKSLSLQYKVPIKMVRGAGQYLMDQYGRKYLDTVNNVAHVGHEHPAVVRAGQEQMALINTNSRYLHENINELAKELLETLPPELSVLHFVNSGSEANELAIRMVKSATGQRDIIASEVGYHGNTNMCIDISSYKFDGKGGQGAPEHTHIFPLPDAFRGKYRGKDTGEQYAMEVRHQIDNIQAKGRGVGAFIIEPIISCGGQIELPKDFLAKAYQYVGEAGGLCISDEVQVGCGRMGTTFWGFQLHGVVPDIVTIGKPLGNGHPLAAVACTQEVAERFANGMEYFNTFGGNPVSCAIGAEVLRVVKREKLQSHALAVGNYLKKELIDLAKKFPIIGDVRGQGLFLGIELVDEKMEPLAAQTDYLANRMKDHGILMSTDGPDHNILKIKPPMVFTQENAEELIFYLKGILAEDFMINY